MYEIEKEEERGVAARALWRELEIDFPAHLEAELMTIPYNSVYRKLQ